VIDRKDRGFNVQVIADKTALPARASGIDPLAATDMPIWIVIRFSCERALRHSATARGGASALARMLRTPFSGMSTQPGRFANSYDTS
jgi:hypothetical protein